MNERRMLSDIVDSLIEKHGLDRKDAELFVKNMFELIKDALTTEKYVKIKGLGTFKLTEVDSRGSVDINTGERIEIQGHTKISFTPDSTMKELINKPFSHFESVVLNDGVELEDVLLEAEEVQKVEEVIGVPSVDEEMLVAEEEVGAVESESFDVESQQEVVVEETSSVKVEEELLKEDNKPEDSAMEETSDTSQPELLEKESDEQAPVEDMEESLSSTEEAVANVEDSENLIEETLVVDVQEKAREVQTESALPSEMVVLLNQGKRTIRILWVVIVVLILVILCGCYWMFMKSEATSDERYVPSSVQEEQHVVIEQPVSEEVKEDTLMVEEKVENVVQEQAEAVVVPLPAPKNKRVASLADTLEYRIVGTKATYTLQHGESIIKASVKFFGSKMFWPYIVKHNRDVIKNPDDIPIGTQIKIPELVPNE